MNNLLNLLGLLIVAGVFFMAGYVYRIGQNLNYMRSEVIELTETEFRGIVDKR